MMSVVGLTAGLGGGFFSGILVGDHNRNESIRHQIWMKHDPDLLSRLDPPLNTSLELPALDLQGKPLPPDVVVVYMGTCSSCTLKSTPPKTIKARGKDVVVLLYDGHPSE